MPKKVLLVLFFLFAFGYSLSARPSRAAISACSVSVSPQSLNTGESEGLVFNVTNNDDSSDSIRYIKITTPSSNFVITHITGPYESGFNINDTGSEVILKLSGLPQGANGDYAITVTTGSNPASSASFGVQVSDTDAGDNLISCSAFIIFVPVKISYATAKRSVQQ